MKKLYARRPEVVERAMGDEIFLVNPDSDETYYLNVTGAALWRLFAEPTCVETVLEVLQVAFPEVERNQLEGDVVSSVADLLEHGLLTETR